MMVRSFALALPLAVLSLAAPVRGDDAPKTHTVVLRTHWTTGAVVSVTNREAKVQAVLKVVDGKEVEAEGFGKEQSSVEHAVVIKCLEADAEGHSLKSILHFSKYESRKGEVSDTSLTGVHVEVAGKDRARAVKVVTPGAEVSQEAIAWLDQNYGNGDKGDTLMTLLEPKEPQAAGAVWKVPGEDVVRALDDGKVPLDVSKVKAEAELVSVAGEKATYRIAMEMGLAGLPVGPGVVLPWKDGGVGKIGATFVRGLAADVLDASVEKHDQIDGIAVAGDFEIHFAIKGTETSTITKGGVMPEVAKPN